MKSLKNKTAAVYAITAIVLTILTVYVALTTPAYPPRSGEVYLSVPETGELYVVGFPKGDAVFSMSNGTWSVRISGNPNVSYSSGNFSDVEQWAINQTRRP